MSCHLPGYSSLGDMMEQQSTLTHNSWNMKNFTKLIIKWIKKITQTAVINIVFQRIFKELDVSYASLHTFSKVTVTIFEN